MLSEPLFTIFGQEIYMYGIMLAIALIAAMVVFRVHTDQRKMHVEVQNFGLITTVVAMAGGFLIAALAQGIVSVINGGSFSLKEGITAMPGFIGGTFTYVVFFFGVGHFLFRKKDNVHIGEFHKIFNVAPCCITIAHAFGRLGCMFAGCCHGKPTDSWIGVLGDGHVPVQFFEALFLFALFAVLTVLYFKDKRYTFPVYLISYGIWRIIIEIFRADPERGMIFGIMTSSQFTSILFILAGLVILILHLLMKYGKMKKYKYIAFNLVPFIDYQTKKKDEESEAKEEKTDTTDDTVVKVDEVIEE